MFKRIRQWSNRRKAKKEYNEAHDLREFVYLDEVSVSSLLSSRLGAIPTEFKDAITNSMTTEINGRAEVDALVAKSRLGSSLKSTQSTNHQVVRKATIQATFKDLYEKERRQFILRTPKDYESPPNDASVQQRLGKATEHRLAPWLVAGNRLTRGQLVELEVELQADPVFRASTVLTSVGDLFEDNELLKSQLEDGALSNITQVNSLLEQLMAGLIPLKCRVLGYLAVTIGDKEYIVHEDIWQQLPQSPNLKARPLFLTGVVERELFWKDIRRVLFSKAQVKVLCRLNYRGIKDSWTPVKLVDILGEIAPELAANMNTLGELTMRAMAESQPSKHPTPRILSIYGRLLANRCNIELTKGDTAVIDTIARENSQGANSVLAGRQGFDEITIYISGRFNEQVTTDPEMLVELREAARQQAGIEESSQPNKVNNASDKTPGTLEERYLDTEIVAIYW